MALGGLFVVILDTISFSAFLITGKSFDCDCEDNDSDGRVEALPAGLVLATVDAAEVPDCATPLMVKDHFFSLKALPATSVAPVDIVETYLVELARLAEGSKVAVLPSELRDTIPPIFVVVSAILKVNVLVETERGNIGSLNVTLITEST